MRKFAALWVLPHLRCQPQAAPGGSEKADQRRRIREGGSGGSGEAADSSYRLGNESCDLLNQGVKRGPTVGSVRPGAER